MKLLVIFAILLSSVVLAVPAHHDVEVVSIDKISEDEFEYYPDTGAEEELFAKAMSRLTAEDMENAIDENGDEMLTDEITERTFKHRPLFPHKKRRKGKRFNPRLRVQLKVFRRSSGGASYKYYILQGRNIRHYRVNFSSSQQFRFRRSAQRETRRCLIRKYTKKCLKLPFFIKGFCTTVIAKRCSGEFESFEFANPKTRGKNKVQPEKTERQKSH